VTSGQETHFKQWLCALVTMAAMVVSPARADDTTSQTGLDSGIKVHGHWTIEVRNSDGTLVTRREFENALAFDGPLNLATALGRTATVGLWRLEIDFANYPSGPCVFNGSPIYCLIHESGDTNVPGSGSNDFYTLNVTAPFRPDPNAGTVTLVGTFTVQNPGPIAAVGTALGGCAPTVPLSSCTLGPAFNSYNVLGFSAFSSATIAPISVIAGQLVSVTVVFSFS
jgi:hypothetical protein